MTSALTIKSVSSNPEEAQPGEVVTVSIEIENTNNYDAENINVKLILTEEKGEANPLTGIAETSGINLPFAPYQSSSEKFLEDLKKGDEEDIKFRLIVLPEAVSGIYKIPVEMIYEDDDGKEYTKKDLISVIVNSKPELKISAEDSVIIKGKENKISLRIVNSGLADVKFVYITLEDVSGINVLSENEQYIGDVDSDDFDSVDYRIYVSAVASNILNLPINLVYKDSTNKEFEETKKISLRVYSLKEAQNLGLIAKPSYKYYIIAGGLVIIYIIYRIRKSIKKKRKVDGGR